MLSAQQRLRISAAGTPKLSFDKLRAGPRIVAGGITTGMVRLDDKQYEQFKNMPVGVQDYTAEIGELK